MLVTRVLAQQPVSISENQLGLWNTLVTGILQPREGWSVDEHTKVIFLMNGQQIAETKSRGGMFVIDLKGIAKPESMIEVFVPGKKEGYGWVRKERRITIQLHQAQNMVVQLAYSQTNPDHVVRPMRLKTGGLSDI